MKLETLKSLSPRQYLAQREKILEAVAADYDGLAPREQLRRALPVNHAQHRLQKLVSKALEGDR